MKEYAPQSDKLPDREAAEMAIATVVAFPELSQELETMILTQAGVDYVPEGPTNPHVAGSHRLAEANHQRAVEQVRDHLPNPS